MWLFSKKGFFSAVRNRNDGRLVHVRAQFRGDLERLLSANELEATVVATPDGDYRFRTDVTVAAWKRIVAREAMTIDYAKFKPAVHGDAVRDMAYLESFMALMRGGRAAAIKESLTK